MSVIEVENIRLVYSKGTSFEKTALQDVSFSIESGEFVGIIGHTGSGKSTLVQLLNGLLRPTAGKVLLNGKDIWEEPKKIREVRFQVGMANLPLICPAAKNVGQPSQASLPWIPMC